MSLHRPRRPHGRIHNPTANRSTAVDYIVRHNPFNASALSGRYTHSTETGRLHREAADNFRAAQRQAGGDGLYVVYSYHTPIAWWSSGAGWTVLGKNDLVGSPTTSGHISVVQKAVGRASNPGRRGARRLHRAGNPINERGEFYKNADDPFIAPDFYLIKYDISRYIEQKPKYVTGAYEVYLVDLSRHVYLASMTPSIEGEFLYTTCITSDDLSDLPERAYDKAWDKVGDYEIDLESYSKPSDYFDAYDVKEMAKEGYKVELTDDTLAELQSGEMTYEEVVEDLREYYRGNRYI